LRRWRSPAFPKIPASAGAHALIDAGLACGDNPPIVMDGWNIDVIPVSSRVCDIAPGKNAQVRSWPETGLAN